MPKKALIHCVDDEPVNLAIMQELLQDRYDLTTADSADGCLRQVGERIPDLILLDVNMPEVDGLETCRRLRGQSESAEVPIIFVSALTTQEDLMAGYEAGGDDYITKPFSEEILQKKIEVVLASQRRKQELKNISDSAVAALMSNLGTTGELRLLVGFLQRCQTAQTADDLAAALFECLAEFELDSSLLLVERPQSRVWFSDDIERPMERQILESLRGQDRVISFGTRMAINSEHATILVRNLPAGGDYTIRLRERLAILAEGLEARIRALDSRRLLDRRRDALSHALRASRETLQHVDACQQRLEEQAAKILAALRGDLEKSIERAGLSTACRDELLGRLSRAGGRMEELCVGDGLVGDSLRAVIEDLERALEE